MRVTVSEVRFGGAVISPGMLTDGQWQYQVTLACQPVAEDGPIGGAAASLLRLAGWQGDHQTTLSYPAGEAGEEPAIQQVGTDAMGWVLSQVHAAREAWNGRTVGIVG